MVQNFGAAFGALVKRQRGKTGLSQGDLGIIVFTDRDSVPDVLKQDVSKLERGLISNPQEPTIAAYRKALADKGHPITDAEMAAIRTTPDAAENELTLALLQRNQALAADLHLKDKLVLALARNYTPDNPADFDSAMLGLAAALQTAADMQTRAELPDNTGDQVHAIRARVAELNNADEQAAADDAINAALAQLTAQQAAVLDLGINQSRLRNAPATAAQRLAARLMLDTPPDVFDALRSLQDEWFKLGHSKGLDFETKVAINLAEANLSHARTANQRGAALNDLALAFYSIGARDAVSTQLKRAIDYHILALDEYPREQSPFDWALTQMNLGNALRTLGEQEWDPLRLNQAINSLKAALSVLSPSLTPIEWAAAQMNLGAAMRTLGEREDGTNKIEEAVTAYKSALAAYDEGEEPYEWARVQMNLANALMTLGKRTGKSAEIKEAIIVYNLALKVRTQESVPLEWALTQMNLGSALMTLGWQENCTAHLDQAMLAFTCALTEYSHDRAPMQKALTELNLARLYMVYFNKTKDPAHLTTARAYVLAARAVFVAAKATHYIGKADEQLAEINARL